MADKSIAHDDRNRNSDVPSLGLSTLQEHEDGDGRFLSMTQAGSADRPAVARFAGSLTGPDVFSAVLRALQVVDGTPSAKEPLTIDLRAVHEADRHTLCSISVWMLQRFSRQAGPVQFLLQVGSVADTMLRVLPAKPRAIQWDSEQNCLVVDVEPTTAAAALLGQMERVAQSL